MTDDDRMPRLPDLTLPTARLNAAARPQVEVERDGDDLRLMFTVDLAAFRDAWAEVDALVERAAQRARDRARCTGCGHRRDLHPDLDVTTHADAERVTVGGACWASVPVVDGDDGPVPAPADVGPWSEGVRISDCPCKGFVA